MGKAAKTKRRLLRRAEKQKRKAAQRALYAKWRDEGRNSKSKRSQRRARRERRGPGTRDLMSQNIGDLHHHTMPNIGFLVHTYLLERDLGLRDQHHSKCRSIIAKFCEDNNLSMLSEGKTIIRHHANKTTKMSFSDIQHLARNYNFNLS